METVVGERGVMLSGGCTVLMCLCHRLSHGMETVVGERGVMLSGGCTVLY